ncbi:MAG TPA: PAS domain S-box protein [Steroidobacteraceae bacterium]|nr:PAS domain S-box protein [Steroidobacteraceae bacterium]
MRSLGSAPTIILRKGMQAGFFAVSSAGDETTPQPPPAVTGGEYASRSEADGIAPDTTPVDRPGAAPDTPPSADALEHQRGAHCVELELEVQSEQLRNTQDELERSRDRYAELFASAPVGYVIVRFDGTIVEANRYACELLESPASPTGRPLLAFIHFDDRMLLHRQMLQLIHSEEARSLQVRLLPHAGMPRRVALQADRVRDPSSRELLVRFVVIDIEEQSRLREELERLASIVASSQDAIVSRDLEGRVTSWNDGARRLFGYGAVEMIGQTLDVLVPGEERATEWVLLSRLRRGETIDHVDAERLARGGMRVPVWMSLAPIRDEHRRIVGSTLIARDATERRRADRALRERLRQLDILCQAGQALILGGDVASMRHELFERLRQAVGCQVCLDYEAEPTGATARLAWASGLLEQVEPRADVVWLDRSAFGAAARRGAALVVDGIDDDAPDTPELLRRLGARCYAAFPMQAGGRLWGIAVFASADRQEFGEGNVQVVQTVCDQMAAMLERSRLLEELHEREQALRTADRAKDTFIATLAHELRNPLAPIRNAVEVMRRDDETQPRRLAWCRDVIGRQVAQLSHLLEDLLDISRLERNRVELRRERLDMNAIVQQAIESVRPLLDARAHRCSVDLPHAPVPIDADPTRLTQVFTNLLNNAAKYTDRGGTIAVAVAVAEGVATIRVRDNGIGIPPAHLADVFEMFTQFAGKPAGGLGIGLALTRGLVELHGGRIEGHSEGPGHGSEFVVTLPVLTSRAGHLLRDPSHDPHECRIEATFRVLVVDDNIDAAQTLASMLAAHGQEARAAYGGPSALEIAEQWSPDAVFLDLGMPDMSGLDVCRVLRERRPEAPPLLVACTGWGQEADRLRSSEAGFDAHLVKPVEPAEVLRLLQSIVPRQRAYRHA